MSNHILIVEDDPDILSSLAEVIREEGYDVETAANGYQALAKLEAAMPDLIFLDLMMPLMDGWKFMETVKQRFPEMAARVVLLSAIKGLSEEANKMGVHEYLTKPFDLEDVTRVTHRLCPNGSEDRAGM